MELLGGRCGDLNGVAIFDICQGFSIFGSIFPQTHTYQPLGFLSLIVAPMCDVHITGLNHMAIRLLTNTILYHYICISFSIALSIYVFVGSGLNDWVGTSLPLYDPPSSHIRTLTLSG
jgi:hypothetical protein